MKALVLMLVVAVAQGSVLPGNTALGYIEKSMVWAEKLRVLEEEQNQRIIGGSAASLGQFPYQAGLLSDIVGFPFGNGICGGSLVSANRLITAAHCWFDGVNQGWRYTVVLGSTTIWNGGTRIQTTNVVMHPNWFPALVRNDIAVIYLPSSVSFTNNIAPVSLPTGSELAENFANSNAIASGFGATRNGSSASPTLNHVSLTVITNAACSPSFPLILHETNICTSGAGIVGACQGDSGGPLVVERNGRRVLVGVTSFGPGAAIGCEGGRPSVFARVTSFISFILQNL